MSGVTSNTVRLVAAYSGPFCPVPGCGTLLVQELSSGESRYTGQLAHIRSPRPGGPRHDPAYPDEKLNSHDNLIMLCPNHHDEIDSDTSEWPIERLEDLREAQEAEAKRRYGFTPWQARFYAVHYLNVPRLAWLATLVGVTFPSELDVLHPPKEISFIPFMSAISELLRQVHPMAIPIARGSDPEEIPLGALGSFNRGVRTKNYRVEDGQAKPRGPIGDWMEGPQIYFDEGPARVILPIDPSYITTTTAQVAFTSGQTRLAGLCQIKEHVGDIGRKRGVVASPLILGLESSLMVELNDHVAGSQQPPSDSLPF